MNTDQLARQIEAMRGRVAALGHHTGPALTPLPERLPEALEELQTALEELRAAEEELREQNEELGSAYLTVRAERQRYQELFDLAPDGYLVTDLGGVIREANRAAAALLNVVPDFLIGKPLSLFIAAEDRSAFRKELRRLCQVAAQPAAGRATEWEARLQPRQAAPIAAALTVAAVYDPSGKPAALRWLVRDVTDRKQAEETAWHLFEEQAARAAAEAAQRRVTFLAKASHLLAASLDYEATLAQVAQLAVPDLADWCAVDLVAEDGSVHRLAAAHVDPEKVALARELQRCCPESPEAPHGVAQVLHTGQSDFMFEIPEALPDAAARDADHRKMMQDLGLKSYLCVPLAARDRTLGVLTLAVADSGRLYGPDDLMLAEDLARRAALAIDNARLYQAAQEAHAVSEAARRALTAANRQKDQFLAMLAHELRNPLAPILTAVQLLEFSESIDPRLRRAREVIERQVHHQARLIDDLLDLSRVTHGKITLQRTQHDLTTVVAEAAEACLPAMEEKCQTLRVALPEEPLPVHADSVRLDQVVTNLLTNAQKYTPPDGTIWLSAAREGEAAVVRVRDTGIGISPELQPRVFDLFTQADTSLDRPQGGLGVGLTLVKRLVELHGGTVEAHSAGLGTGSEFVVCLPLGTAEGVAVPALQAALEKGGRRRRVVLVEDNPHAREVLADLLELQGHYVLTAESGAAAVRLAEKEGPDAFVIDIGLPGMDGYEVARRLRQRRPEGEHYLLIALTGYGGQRDQERSRAAGFDAHLLKPADFEELERLLTGAQPR